MVSSNLWNVQRPAMTDNKFTLVGIYGRVQYGDGQSSISLVTSSRLGMDIYLMQFAAHEIHEPGPEGGRIGRIRLD